MNNFKYAYKSITRSWVRNLLIGAVVFIVTLASLISLSVQQSAQDIVSYQKDSYEIQGTLVIDRNQLRSFAADAQVNMRTLLAEVPQLELAEINYFAESPSVKDLYFDLYFEFNSDSLLAVGEEAIHENDEEAGKGTNSTGSSSNRGTFKVIGYNSIDAIKPFLSGNYSMVEGSVFDIFDQENAILISEDMATTNGFSVGEIINLDGNELIIVGTYRDESSIDSVVNWSSATDNQILTSYEVANLLSEFLVPINRALNATFVLTSVEMIESFKQELLDKGLHPLYSLRSNNSSFEQAMKPYLNLIDFSTTMLVVITSVGGLILLTINMINIRERKYEIGVLRAIGMKKRAVASFFLTEMILVTAIALVIGIGIGGVSTEAVGNYMLKEQIAQVESEEITRQTNLGMDNVNSRNNGSRVQSIEPIEYINEMRTPINQAIVFQIALIGVLIVLLGSSISLISISKYEPLSILASRA